VCLDFEFILYIKGGQSMALEKESLINIFGKEGVCDDPGKLKTYACDQSFTTGETPDFAVFPENTEQIQELVKLANKSATPLVPYSSGLNLHGAALPARGGIVVNLSKMNRILQVDEENWFAIVEPGVTYKQLQEHLSEKGYRAMIPFGVPPQRSILSSYLERDPVLTAASFEYGNYLIMDTEIVLPEGQIFKTGQWSTGGDPGGAMGPIRNVIYRLWTGAQGTLGIVTKMGVQITPLIKERKLFFMAFDSLEESIDTIRQIQKREIGMECFLLNSFNLAAMLNTEWTVPEVFPAAPNSSKNFETLRTELPPWVLTICIQGSPRHSEKKIAYEVEALEEVCRTLKVTLQESLPQALELNSFMLDELNKPWKVLKKFNYRGSVQTLSFKSPLQDIDKMKSTVSSICEAHGYDSGEIGAFLLPLERGRAVHCEFDLHCDQQNDLKLSEVKKAWREAGQELMDQGACFDRPYGDWAEMVYKRSGNYTVKLKEVKAEMDPCSIMNPGKLCFD
jgi:FAD/FMN-containing dehydrogenase